MYILYISYIEEFIVDLNWIFKEFQDGDWKERETW